MPFSQINIIPFFSFNIKVRVNLKCKEYSFEALTSDTSGVDFYYLKSVFQSASQRTLKNYALFSKVR